jgi:predicted membrane-bound spermidine synthase
MRPPADRQHLAVGLLSVAAVALQLALMRLLAITQWHHFAYMVISVSLLGFGAAGTLLTIRRDRFLARQEQLLPLLMLGSAAATALLPWLGRAAFARFDTYLLFTDPGQAGRLLLGSLACALPFFLAALAIGLIFAAGIERIATLYFANLFGSGVGGGIGLLLPALLPPAQLPAATALFALAAGLLLWPQRGRPAAAAVALLAVAAAGLGLLVAPAPLLSQYKDLERTLALPEARIVAERRGPYGLVQAVASPALRWGPGLSLTFAGEVPVRAALFVDGNGFGPVLSGPPGEAGRLLDQTAAALPYALREPKTVLVLGAGTGAEVAQALAHGVRRVTAVEPHRAVLELLEEAFPESAGALLRRPAVSVIPLEPRTQLAADPGRYDLIVIPTLGAFGGSAGLFALQEQQLLTVEGFAEAIRHLAPDGLFCVSAWLDYPPRAPLRLAATLAEALTRDGIADPAAHLAAVRSWGTITFCASRSPLTGAEVEAVRAFAERLQFDPALLPGLLPEERQRFHLLEDPQLLDDLVLILSNQRETLYRSYDFRLRPASDNRPFFSQFLRWRSLPHLSRLFGERSVPFLEMGYLIAVVTFAELTVAAVVLILLPLRRLGRTERNRRAVLLYFSGLGVGYMLVELVLIHRFVLYLGPPVLAAAVVIAALLVFSGVGSYLSGRLEPTPATPRRAAATVAVLLLFTALLLPPLLEQTIGWPLPAKLLVTLVALAPASVAMGFPFPLGLRLLGRLSEAQVPWAWGINGCLSVVSASLATILAVEAGFTFVQGLAAAIYAAAALARFRE